ncbi:uncharacterized, partial [Tachysurus ichikawai]
WRGLGNGCDDLDVLPAGPTEARASAAKLRVNGKLIFCAVAIETLPVFKACLPAPARTISRDSEEV